LQQESCKSSSHMSIDYRKFSGSEKGSNELTDITVNMHMHRMTSHSISLKCWVIVTELLGVGNSKITA
jgi:hypothetical protein